ncbi:phosphonate degradation HD-domain oxygenase [Vogesella indigofera]|uniref:phosphonate degradation HD-domain oxygenase n=1 Tax=Vogesella indigofera TaxID=45465 RepID=UPI00234E9556|nr:phosphonate degradation HD-domain oxygenase [Vogesella indigofera]MDC7700326.1 HD domain-containing protein [Vogesella indigofera]
MIYPAFHTLDDLFTQLATQGHSLYGGEAVSQLEHALQSALAAEQAGASDALITAALLHDVGHIVTGQRDDDITNGLDDHHEAVAVQVLGTLFDDEVLMPIALHVAAKRYLCATRRDYLTSLSNASRQSLVLQGGPMSASEVQRFACRPHANAAIALRHYDDIAKTPALPTPPLQHYQAIAANVLKALS